MISDQHAGLVAALRRSFQGVGHQRCRVHFARNLLALVPRTHTDMVAAVFRTIFAQPDADTVAATWDEVRDQLTARFPTIGPLMDNAKAEGPPPSGHCPPWPGSAGTVVHVAPLNTPRAAILRACQVPPPATVTALHPL